ncbi:GGDEF domain-containing protein [Rheinheimera sp. YQF-2]|uniref:GGDEF domain-containing protein n=1 Tax=Rheinheimera lutimaris TaxID=2740584 RepID=A0A7Y5EGP1_9GAMM|nr:GGDEF domain-containing protein [Rheinheimera lutimaris]NRQ41564.1 GGDEF domain-containing protein [Rheinheimera lutimaris]
MRIFRTLLISQLLSALILAMVALVIMVIYTQQQLISSQQNAHKAIEQIISHHITGDGKILSRQLDRSFALKSLRISQLDNTILHEQNLSGNKAPLATTLLQWFGTEFKPYIIRNQEQNIQVSYQLDFTERLQQFQLMLLVLFLLPFIIGWLPVLLSKSSISRSYRRTTAAVNDLIDRFITDPQKAEPDWQKIPPEFSDINTALQKLANYTRSQYNEMASNAHQIAEEAYKDPVTDLPNRNRFVQHYEENIRQNEQNDFGVFAITRCTELQTLNQTRGYQEGDSYIREIADILKKLAGTYKDYRIYRLNSSDFGLLLPRVTPKEAENFALQLQSRFNEYQKTSELDSVAYTGLVTYESGKALGELLAVADTSISLAQTKQPNAWHLQKESAGLEMASGSYGNQNWRNVIDDVLTNHRISLLVQLIQPSNRSAKAYSEILVRFKTQEGQILPTASFLAMAEKLDRIVAVDRLIIETALTTIKNKNLQDQYFGLNLSARCVHDDQFIIWLERRLLKDAHIAAKLIFEVTEFGLQQNLKTSKRFIDMVHRAGARITVEKFGVGITSFKFFRDLKPDFVKMDGSYTRHINEDKNNQYFMRLMIDLAHRIGVGVFAESVETQEEKHMLESLFIDGNQGYYVGKPAPI